MEREGGPQCVSPNVALPILYMSQTQYQLLTYPPSVLLCGHVGVISDWVPLDRPVAFLKSISNLYPAGG